MVVVFLTARVYDWTQKLLQSKTPRYISSLHSCCTPEWPIECNIHRLLRYRPACNEAPAPTDRFSTIRAPVASIVELIVHLFTFLSKINLEIKVCKMKINIDQIFKYFFRCIYLNNNFVPYFLTQLI